MLHQTHAEVRCRLGTYKLRRAVGAAVIDHDDFVGRHAGRESYGGPPDRFT